MLFSEGQEVVGMLVCSDLRGCRFVVLLRLRRLQICSFKTQNVVGILFFCYVGGCEFAVVFRLRKVEGLFLLGLESCGFVLLTLMKLQVYCSFVVRIRRLWFCCPFRLCSFETQEVVSLLFFSGSGHCGHDVLRLRTL